MESAIINTKLKICHYVPLKQKEKEKLKSCYLNLKRKCATMLPLRKRNRILYNISSGRKMQRAVINMRTHKKMEHYIPLKKTDGDINHYNIHPNKSKKECNITDIKLVTKMKCGYYIYIRK